MLDITQDSVVPIRLRIVFENDVVFPGTARGSFLRTGSNCICIPGSALKGMTRFRLAGDPNKSSAVRSEYFQELSVMMFGTDSAKGDAIFSDFTCSKDFERRQLQSIRIDPRTMAAAPDQIYSIQVLPAGLSFEGYLSFRMPATFNGTRFSTGLQRSSLLSALMGIEFIGQKVSCGFGGIKVEVLDRGSFHLTFISYAWEDQAHREWVMDLSKNLAENGVDLILDRLSPGFSETADQKSTNHWMRNSIDNADRILSILTPAYRRKAAERHGGVGYEFDSLMEENGKHSRRINRYIGILRSGSINESVPPELAFIPIVDMRPGTDHSSAMAALVEMLKRS